MGCNTYKCLLCFAVFLLLALASPHVSLAQIYQWVDDNGTTHFTDDISKIPPKYQNKSEAEANQPRENNINVLPSERAPEAVASPPTNQNKPTSVKATPTPIPDSKNPQKEAYWQKRTKKVRDRLKEIDEKLEGLNLKKRNNLESGPGMHQRSAEYLKEEEALKAEKAKLTKELNEDIPEEARRAGVPPGYLR